MELGKDNGEARVKVQVFDRMEECTEAEVQRMLPLVSAQRREQALKYQHTLGRFCCLKSWLMLKELAAVSIPHSAFKYDAHGKPYWEDGPYFSISHSKEAIAVAIDEKPVGIDIEGIRRTDEDLMKRIMNEEERSAVSSALLADRAFTRIWTQKEAVVKAEGVGIQSFEQLQTVLEKNKEWQVESFETETYIYSIAYK